MQRKERIVSKGSAGLSKRPVGIHFAPVDFGCITVENVVPQDLAEDLQALEEQIVAKDQWDEVGSGQLNEGEFAKQNYCKTKHLLGMHHGGLQRLYDLGYSFLRDEVDYHRLAVIQENKRSRLKRKPIMQLFGETSSRRRPLNCSLVVYPEGLPAGSGLFVHRDTFALWGTVNYLIRDGGEPEHGIQWHRTGNSSDIIERLKVSSRDITLLSPTVYHSVRNTHRQARRSTIVIWY